jgi:hypothetical protein
VVDALREIRRTPRWKGGRTSVGAIGAIGTGMTNTR